MFMPCTHDFSNEITKKPAKMEETMFAFVYKTIFLIHSIKVCFSLSSPKTLNFIFNKPK